MTSKKGRNAGNAHTIVASGKGQPAIRCNAYGSHYPMKSNLGVVEELRRMESALLPADEPSCPDPACRNHGVPVSAGKAFYSSFGKTADGSLRWVCKACTTVDPVTGKKRVKSFSTPARALPR
ncbi:MAG: hypothetical protein WBM25_12275 [Azonexus sp.]|jgi:hypothetical protein